MSEKRSWALEGEDLIATQLLRYVSRGTYFDIGCADPTHLSNTWLFYQAGWRGVAVDAREVRDSWNQIRPDDVFVQAIVGDGSEATFVEFPDPHLSGCDESSIERYRRRFPSGAIKSVRFKTVRAERIWLAHFPEAAPDLVNIDVEGFELAVLSGFNLEGFRPKLFIIELKGFNFLRPLDSPIVNYMAANGYCLVAKTPLDGFFIDAVCPAFDWMPAAMKSMA